MQHLLPAKLAKLKLYRAHLSEQKDGNRHSIDACQAQSRHNRESGVCHISALAAAAVGAAVLVVGRRR